MSNIEDRTALEGTIGPDGRVMFEARSVQLSFDVGMRNDPDFGSVKVKGDMPVPRDLAYGMEVVVTVASLDGEVLTAATGRIALPQFKEHTDRWDEVTFERIHTVDLGA